MSKKDETVVEESDELDDLIEAAEETPEEPVEEPKSEEKKEKKVAAPAKLARGRFPAVLVWWIRFKEEGTDSEIAHKFFTTPGKISDIRKNAGFKYVTEGTKFSKADVEAAVAKMTENFSAGKSRGGKTSDTTIDDAKYTLDCLGKVPTAEESTLEADRAKDRKPRGKSTAKAEKAVEGVEGSAEVVEEVAAVEEAEVADDVSDEDLEAMLND